MQNPVTVLNDFIDLVMAYWDGSLTEEEFEQKRTLHISEEVDSEMQKDTFY